jgi:hypothetical protein
MCVLKFHFCSNGSFVIATTLKSEDNFDIPCLILEELRENILKSISLFANIIAYVTTLR